MSFAPRWIVSGCLVALGVVATSGLNAQSSPKVFPGAMGFGTGTRAAYGGSAAPAILRVTNLNDSGAGSLRAALTASSPRVVVFETSGTIQLQSPIRVTAPYLTVAGATAPSPGITLRGYGLEIRTHDVLVQHIRIRVGNASPTSGDVDSLLGYRENSYNIVIDHVSLSWSIDELFGIGSGYGLIERNITVSNSILSEALNNSGLHSKGAHSKGLLAMEHAHNVSIIGNLFAHNADRNPYLKDDTRAQVVNNLIYNWGSTGATATMIGSYGETYGPTLATVVGNVYIGGPSTPSTSPCVRTRTPLDAGTRLYLNDNRCTQATGYRNDETAFNPLVSTPPVSLSGIAVLSSSSVEASVKKHAGARPADRDAVDVRIVSEVNGRTGRIIDSQSQVGGWPVLAENARPLTLPANPHALSPSGSGYTNLEEWLHRFAAAVEGEPALTLLPPAAPTDVLIVQ